MKLPRDISGNDLIKALSRLGYKKTRQTGSHIRLTTQLDGKHNITIPAHNPIKVGTLNSIFKIISEHHKLNRNELIKILFE